MEGEDFKAILIAIVAVVVIFAVANFATKYVSTLIPAKTGGTEMYLVYKGKPAMFAVFNKDGKIVAYFTTSADAQNFAQRIGGKLEYQP